MEQPIAGYHQDEVGDWVADLACGHGQHVRHEPPLSNRLWVKSQEGRDRFIGQLLNCKICDGDDIRIEPKNQWDADLPDEAERGGFSG